MKSFLLHPDNEPIKFTKNVKPYEIKILHSIKDKLGKCKSQLDVYFETPLFNKYWTKFDPFSREKIIIAKICNTINVTNAWLKCYEMINHFNLIPDDTDGEFYHFDNAAFPGSFIISVYHYIYTLKKRIISNYNWVGSSLIVANQDDADPLEDKYQLYKNYPDNWIMNENFDGDVTVEKNQEYIYKKLENKIDLYTSDLGFDVSSDYTNQELLQCPANIGQIISGLLVLKKGGNFITKQYTFFETVTVNVIYLVSQLFDEFYICKPVTSREANSEIYLVGKGFKEKLSYDHPYIKILLEKINIANIKNLSSPLFERELIPETFLDNIYEAAKSIYTDQIDKIDFTIEEINKCKENDAPIREYKKTAYKIIRKWYADNMLLPLSYSEQLNMKDAYHQRINS